MYLAFENRAVARLVDTAQFLHDRCRQPDLVSRDLASPARSLDRLESGADRIRLVEVRRYQLGWENVDLMPLAEQRGDAFGFLPGIENRHSLWLRVAAQFAADDLAGRGQWQFVDEHDLARRLIPGQPLSDKGEDFLGERRSGGDLGLRYDKRAYHLAAHRVGVTDRRRHQHGRMLHQAILDIGRTDAITAA